MSYNNWEDDYDKTEVEKRRERQRDDSMRIVVWSMLIAGALIMVMLFVRTCADIINNYHK